MDVAAVRAQESAQLATLHAQQQQYRLVTRKLQADWDAARAALNGARRVAQNTPIEVSSAQTALNQATAQYKAGLTSIDNLAQAQRLLVQAQIDDALARLNVWRAVLQMETVEGDIQPFISEVSK
jgi:outer membrane protein